MKSAKHEDESFEPPRLVPLDVLSNMGRLSGVALGQNEHQGPIQSSTRPVLKRWMALFDIQCCLSSRAVALSRPLNPASGSYNDWPPT